MYDIENHLFFIFSSIGLITHELFHTLGFPHMQVGVFANKKDPQILRLKKGTTWLKDEIVFMSFDPTFIKKKYILKGIISIILLSSGKAWPRPLCPDELGQYRLCQASASAFWRGSKVVFQVENSNHASELALFKKVSTRNFDMIWHENAKMWLMQILQGKPQHTLNIQCDSLLNFKWNPFYKPTLDQHHYSSLPKWSAWHSMFKCLQPVELQVESILQTPRNPIWLLFPYALWWPGIYQQWFLWITIMELV